MRRAGENRYLSCRISPVIWSILPAQYGVADESLHTMSNATPATCACVWQIP